MVCAAGGLSIVDGDEAVAAAAWLVGGTAVARGEADRDARLMGGSFCHMAKNCCKGAIDSLLLSFSWLLW